MGKGITMDLLSLQTVVINHIYNTLDTKRMLTDFMKHFPHPALTVINGGALTSGHLQLYLMVVLGIAVF